MKQVFAVIFLAHHTGEHDLLGHGFGQRLWKVFDEMLRLQHEQKIGPQDAPLHLTRTVGRFIAPAVNVHEVQHFVAVPGQQIDRFVKVRFGLIKRSEPQFTLDKMDFAEESLAATNNFRIKPLSKLFRNVPPFDNLGC